MQASQQVEQNKQLKDILALLQQVSRDTTPCRMTGVTVCGKATSVILHVVIPPPCRMTGVAVCGKVTPVILHGGIQPRVE